MSFPPLLTFPLRPANGGQLKHALPKVGQWFYEPKYDGWRAIVHPPTGAMWNRKGERLTIANAFDKVLAHLKNCPFEWLDCEALSRRHGLGKGSLIILDCPADRETYIERMSKLAEGIATAGGTELQPSAFPEIERIYLSPRYWENERDAIWNNLQKANETLGAAFYEGLVAKRNDSLYPLQLRNPEQTSASWQKHRFIN